MKPKTFIVQVRPGAKEERVEEKQGVLRVWTKAPASEGKANKAVKKLIAEHFQISKSRVSIKRGFKSRNKIVFID